MPVNLEQSELLSAQSDVPDPVEHETFTTTEVARRWRTNRTKVLRFIAEGSLRAMDLSLGSKPRYRIRREDLEKFEQSRMAEQPAPKTTRRRKPMPHVKEYF